MNTNTEEWGNIELPGLSDEELFKKNWNYVAANREKANDPNFIKKLSDKISQSYIDNPELIERRRISSKNYMMKKILDPEYKEFIKNRNKTQVNDPAYKNALAKGIEKRNSNTDFIKKVTSRPKKPLVTPDGIFPCRNDAAKFYKFDPAYINTKMKKFPEQYYYISQEEYILLTGKEV